MKTISTKSIIHIIIICLMSTLSIISEAQGIKANASGYAPVNGLKIYYEEYGMGDPVVLLHGSFMNINVNFGAMIPELAKTHRVIALEMQGHGRTADINRALSFTALADDVAGLMNYLKIDSATIVGYSMGATVALELALTHPEKVSKVIFISSVYKSDGWIKPVRDAFAMMSVEMLSNTPLKEIYNSLAPDKLHWKTFVSNMIKFENIPYDLGIENIRKMKAPMLIIQGDNDGVDLAHTTELYTACGGGIFGDMMPMPKSRLAILPATSHVSIMMQTNQLNALILPFIQ
ncbi:MAG TPA: alpha/beta hydrolase [Cyclobacteriaceae bacterium]|jgi:pimeloyl-ACP methyl ester carboxylesterase|nr:alpha/beta hydrolase [Cyclobacteriaceae bacterium]